MYSPTPTQDQTGKICTQTATNKSDRQKKSLPKRQPKVLDLFCGCGGLSYGFMKGGYDVVLGIDSWKESLDTFISNHNGALACEADLSNLHPRDVAERYKIYPNSIDVIIGGPPCQGFSIAGKRESNDPRNRLYKSCFIICRLWGI